MYTSHACEYIQTIYSGNDRIDSWFGIAHNISVHYDKLNFRKIFNNTKIKVKI